MCVCAYVCVFYPKFMFIFLHIKISHYTFKMTLFSPHVVHMYVIPCVYDTRSTINLSGNLKVDRYDQSIVGIVYLMTNLISRQFCLSLGEKWNFLIKYARKC